jgi:hypothetical protein
MFIRKIEDNKRETFVFVIRRPDGSEYEVSVSANSETDAERRLENILEISYSSDEFVGLKNPKNEE